MYSQAGCDRRSIFKQSKTDLNLEFSFETGCLTKTQEPSLPNYLHITAPPQWIHAFLKSMKWNVNTFVQDLNSGHQSYFLWSLCLACLPIYTSLRKNKNRSH